MTTTQNNDDLLIVSDEVKSEDNDFLFFDTPSEVKEETMISFDLPETEAKTEDTSIDFGFSFDTPSETKEEIKFESESTMDSSLDFFAVDTPEEIKMEEVLETKEDSSFDFFASDEVSEANVETEISETIPEITLLDTPTEEIFSEEVSEKISSVVGDLNSILDETISKLELRKTNLFALKDNKSTNIDDLNRQIAELKAKVKDLESEVKTLESEDEQIIANITALQSMKLGEAVNNNVAKKTTKKVA